MKTWFPAPQRTVKALASAAVVVLGLWVTPTLAGDPFRPTNPRNIDPNTEAAFESIFKQGDYKTAQQYLRQAESGEPKEPLVYAMLASLAYLDAKAQSKPNLEVFSNYATKTRETGEQMAATDPLRGNLYTAVGHFLEGAYNFEQEGPVRALNKLQKVFHYLDEAKKSDPQDPELNLLTGYMDLMLAVNLPFSDPAEAIKKLEDYGYPKYLAYRGIAVGYRDLKKYSQALDYVNRALELTPDNPEVLYLKAQILLHLDKTQEALTFFNRALEKKAQLPNYSAAQITYEQCKAQNSLDNGARNCRDLRNQVRAGNN
ncbi:MAG TPA: hypothetical protein DDZ80_10420 [Cyanobacteria bacterium UBA8803]|nr:hypothetical protein [Cyanobacteria bacterium UBA9273]HBL58905.1 hypothetical protein [Cyanobacteria bacterium UBA8803]